jgi:hypothetical protein
MLNPKLSLITLLGVLTMLLCCTSKASPQGDAPGGGESRARLEGKWSAKVFADGEKVRLSLERGGGGWSSVYVPAAQLRGLEPSHISAADARVSFRLIREAGTFIFEGQFKKGEGTGRWEFEGDAGFADGLGQVRRARPSVDELFALALSDVGLGYVREMEGAGYGGLSAKELVALYTNGVDAGYVAGLGRVGYKGLAVNELLALKTNGITADDVRAYVELLDGGVEAMQSVALKSNQVSVAYLRSLAEEGVRPTASQAVALRANGVTLDFVRRVRARGHKDLTAERLLSLRLNGAEP